MIPNHYNYDDNDSLIQHKTSYNVFLRRRRDTLAKIIYGNCYTQLANISRKRCPLVLTI